MVVIGNYSASIVNAETKVAFQEHNHRNGKTYAEVEPCVDFYIEINIVGGNDNIYCVPHVDGQKLKYCITRHPSHDAYHAGLWSRSKGVSKMRAFSFQKPTFKNEDGSTSNSAPGDGLMGTIQVDFYEAVYLGISHHSQGDYSNDVQEDNVSPTSVLSKSDLSFKQTKKVLRSGGGSHSESTQCSSHGGPTHKYGPGKLLQSITVHYCTALGLIYAGVLPPPPGGIWGLHRMEYARKPGDDDNSDLVQVKRAKLTKDGTEHDVLDMSKIADSDNEE